MTTTVRRPVRKGDGNGILDHDNFQIAYATNDLERACAVFADRYGIREFRTVEGYLDGGAHVRAELAWVGGMMYELIQARGPGSEFINQLLPPNAFGIRLHHSAFFVYDELSWQALQRDVELGGWRVLHRRTLEGFLQVFYLEAPELGQYLEYIFPEPAAIAFFEDVPRS